MVGTQARNRRAATICSVMLADKSHRKRFTGYHLVSRHILLCSFEGANWTSPVSFVIRALLFHTSLMVFALRSRNDLYREASQGFPFPFPSPPLPSPFFPAPVSPFPSHLLWSPGFPRMQTIGKNYLSNSRFTGNFFSESREYPCTTLEIAHSNNIG